ncbi:MAG: glycosyltransferase family 2 protein [Deltaproteobacteria bacterium]|jgi:glycosyltransferase involved in cell wall biosynthesis|nr:glycosyltransferase family 2 protein [Deltaproteobacteria bacterium]
MNLDVVVLTKNEEKNITDCLRSFRGLGRAVVIDDGSTDRTVALAQAQGAQVHYRSLDSFAEQRNFALTKTDADWIFFLDADERFTPALRSSVEKFVSRPQPAAGSIRRVNYAFGRRHRFGHLAPDRVTRLFPRGRVKWERAVHESPETDLPIEKLEGFLEHHTYGDWNRYLDKFVGYARLWAEEEFQNGRRTTALSAVLHAAAAFFKMAVQRLGFLEGSVGWALCWYHGGYTLSKYLLLLQKQNHNPPGPEGEIKDNSQG